jgi:hypothetical protein
VLLQQSWLRQSLHVVLNGTTCMILVASMLQMAVHTVLLTRHAIAWGFQLLYTQQQAMLVRQACHKHHRKHMHGSPAAAVGTRQK